MPAPRLAAQVRTYLANCAETHEKEQVFMRRRVGEMLGEPLDESLKALVLKAFNGVLGVFLEL